MNCWIDWCYNDDDEDDLLKEFEKMLNGESNEYQMPKKTYISKPMHCHYHDWELVGRSPVLDEPWYNCKKCGISKEKYERKTKRPLL